MATTFCTPLDNATTTLGSDHAAGSGTLAVKAGAGARFGSPSPSAPVRVTVVPASAVDSNGFLTDPSGPATFLATGRTGDTLTGLRLESGTDGPFEAGDFVAVLIDARTVSDIHAAVHALEAGGGGSGGGTGGGATFTFDQMTPASTWVIVHGLGRYPPLTVVDSAGSVVVGEEHYDSPDQITVTFPAGAFAGQAYVG